MFDYMEYCLHKYFEAGGRNQDHLYSNLCRSSLDIIDFKIPEGINIHATYKPTDHFKNSISAFGAPNKIKGSLGFVYTSRALNVPPTSFALHNQIMDKFYFLSGQSNVSEVAETLESKEKENSADYLAYGHIYLPRCRLEALLTQKISDSLQYIVSGVSIPYDQDRSHLSFLVQQEGKHWCTEYSYSTDDYLFGIRSLYRFFETTLSKDSFQIPKFPQDSRWYMGGELYYSASTKIGGVSLGLRRQTMLSTPSDFTLTLNPVMGHFSMAYTNMMNSQLTASTRYYFNTHSLESDYAVGVEWRNSNEGLIKAKFSMAQGAAILFSSRYRKLHFTLGLNIASPLSSILPTTSTNLYPHSMLRSMGIHFQYSS